MKPKYHQRKPPKNKNQGNNELKKVADGAESKLEPSGKDNDVPNNHEKNWDKFWLWAKTGLEFVAIVAGVCLAWFTYQTLNEIRLQTPSIVQSAEIANRNLISSQRAYLTIGKVDELMGGVALNISVVNYGHTPIRHISANLTYRRIKGNTTTNIHVAFKSTSQINDNTTIAPGPGPEYALLATLPRLSVNEKWEVGTGEQSLAIQGRIYYDAGFGISDTLRFLLVYNPTSGQWTHGPGGNKIDLRTEEKKEITYQDK